MALAAVVCYALLVVTGGAVRLTGSGLGCPDWPSCYQHRLIAQLSLHPMIEDVNRFVTVAVSVVSVVAFLAAVFRVPRRRDLVVLSGGLVAGLLAQIVLGGLVVLFKLNPYLVSLHFLLTILVLANAIVLYHRSGVDDARCARTEALVGRDLVWLGRLLLGTLAVLSTIGTIVSGSGPHAGAPSTPGAPIKRIPIAFRDIAEVHVDVALFLIGLTLAALFAFHHAKAPERIQHRARLMLELEFVQGVLGYTQYFLHDSPVVVEFHLAGVTALWVAAVGFYLSLHDHPPAPAPAEEPGVAARHGTYPVAAT